jgi:hypothetical protein
MPSFDSAPSGVDAPRWLVSVFLASLSLWVGAAVFLTGAVLPALFFNLETADAGRIAALVFPIYFRAGFAVGIVTCVAAALLARGQGRLWRGVVALVVLMTLAQGWSAVVVHPEMARIRGVDSEVVRFQDLHKLSVRLNSVVLGGGVLLLAASGVLFSRRRAAA